MKEREGGLKEREKKKKEAKTRVVLEEKVISNTQFYILQYYLFALLV